MKKLNKTNLLVTAGLYLLFVLYTLAIMYIDVKPIGPRASSVGFAALNNAVHKFLGVNMTLYEITDWLSILAIFYILGFAILGLCQLIKRKSFFKVDHSILVLGGFYLLVMAAYLFFEFNVINRRPVIIEGILEASYPSSTTMLVMCVMPTAMLQFRRLISSKGLKTGVNTFTGVFSAAMVLGRLISGVHWLTDILGGILLSAALVMTYYSADFFFNNEK